VALVFNHVRSACYCAGHDDAPQLIALGNAVRASQCALEYSVPPDWSIEISIVRRCDSRRYMINHGVGRKSKPSSAPRSLFDGAVSSHSILRYLLSDRRPRRSVDLPHSNTRSPLMLAVALWILTDMRFLYC